MGSACLLLIRVLISREIWQKRAFGLHSSSVSLFLVIHSFSDPLIKIKSYPFLSHFPIVFVSDSFLVLHTISFFPLPQFLLHLFVYL